ncbi:MAG TPA: hypothetical protein DCS63_03765 [Elusimicrobia bacterium]|nr:hypothetical protein [Elusimicrobiota bacterium]
MIMKAASSFLIFVLSAGINLAAGDFNAGAKGTTGAAFLTMGMGARALGMGEAYSAVAADASAVSWNPAGLVRAPEISVMFMHANYLAGISFDYLSFARSNGSSAFGGAVAYLNGGEVERTDEAGNNRGTYQPRDYAATIGYALDLEVFGADSRKYGAGVAGKYLSSKIVEKAGVFAFDAGLTARTSVDDMTLRLAFVAQNLGGGIKLDKKADPLPTTLKAGGALQLDKNWLISADVAAPRGNSPYICAGVEHAAYRDVNIRVLLRFGVNTLTLGDISGITAVSGGFGLVIKNAAVDYAAVPFGDLGLTHRLSLTMRFGNAGNDPGGRVKRYGEKSAKKNSGGGKAPISIW